MNPTTQQPTYELLKDLPDGSKPNDKYTYMEGSDKVFINSSQPHKMKIPFFAVVNSPDWFRRVEVKDWEVVAYIHQGRETIWKQINYSDFDWQVTIPQNPNLSIHSVRRLSDGETFTVGDSVGWGINGFYQTKIESFRLKDGSLEFKYKMMNFGNYSFVDFIKAANLHKKLPSTPSVEQETIKDDGKSKIVSQFDMYNIGYKDAIKYMDVIISEAQRKAFEAARGKVGRSNSDKFSEVTIEDKYPTFSDYIQSLKK